MRLCVCLVMACTLGGCGPISSTIWSGVSGIYAARERKDLEIRIEMIEKKLKSMPGVLDGGDRAN